jgi:hypothetical protein
MVQVLINGIAIITDAKVAAFVSRKVSALSLNAYCCNNAHLIVVCPTAPTMRWI